MNLYQFISTRETEREKKDLEFRVEELTIKASKYSETLNENKKDLLSLKIDLKEAISQQDDAQNELLVLRKKNEELSTQNKILHDTLARTREVKDELEERVAKLTEVNNITRADYKLAKEDLNSKPQELRVKDREIRLA